ncbi:MAG TPA: branched-chain amino acid ABC transporter ATP-binding protein/permease [Ilumatobacteraceae bacterium]|nr:branched-chain amino acid ABC transporter ATP-binding protein/permease [Ilumatobacteraceae bacterium]
MELWLNYLDQVLIYATLALSLNLLLGYAGQVSVAHASFGAIGGYAMGYLSLTHNWNFLFGTVIGMALAFVIGSIVALPALKLTVEYLILLTLAVSSVILGLLIATPSMGGTFGLIGLPTANLFGWHLREPHDWVLPSLVAMLIVYAICHRIGESPTGRVLKGIREDPISTQALGKNVFGYKVAVFGISSALAAFAGALLAAWLQLATPSVYGFAFALTIFAIVIFGGMGNLTGTVLGAAVVVLLEPVLRRVVKIEAARASIVQLIVYGLALAVLMRVRPQGALPEGFSIWRWLRGERARRHRIEMVEGWVPKSIGVHERAQAEGVDDVSDEIDRHRKWLDAPVVLETSGVGKRFGGIVAANDLHIELRRGTIAALVGPNGAGKTTVFNLLTGAIAPDAGSVKLNGEELVGLNPAQVARKGLVRSFQDVRLFNRLSCLQNVMMAVQHQAGENFATLAFAHRRVVAVEEKTRTAAMDWLGFVGMTDFADVPAGALSYGQTKLVSLARVLATEAEVLLLDEPASGIDTRWVDTILDLIETVREQGRTVCVVEHNLHVVGRLADHTYFMELGEITAAGTIAELTNTPRLAEAYFGTS